MYILLFLIIFVVCKTCPPEYAGRCEICNTQSVCVECIVGFWDVSEYCRKTCMSITCTCNNYFECLTCKDGYYGIENNCNRKCSSGCNRETCYNDGTCLCKPDFTGSTCDSCVDGKYGANCSMQCSRGCEGINCSPIDGSCNCREYYSGVQCDICIADRYGDDCSKQCSVGCLDRNCSPTDGKCDCKDFYTGDKCDVCENGRYSENDCDQICSSGCNDQTCNLNGTCICKPNFAGSTCDSCVDGKYGANCSMQCSRGCEGNSCSSSEGTCSCRRNFCGERCENCIASRFGEDCSKTCSLGCLDNICFSTDGSCDCREFFTGAKCDVCVEGRHGDGCLNSSEQNHQDETDNLLIGALTGGVIGAVVVLVAAFAITVLVKRRLSQKEAQDYENKREATTPGGNATQPGSYETLNTGRIENNDRKDTYTRLFTTGQGGMTKGASPNSSTMDLLNTVGGERDKSGPYEILNATPFKENERSDTYKSLFTTGQTGGTDNDNSKHISMDYLTSPDSCLYVNTMQRQ